MKKDTKANTLCNICSKNKVAAPGMICPSCRNRAGLAPYPKANKSGGNKNENK